MSDNQIKTTLPDGRTVIVAPMKSALRGFIRRSCWIIAIYLVFSAAAVTFRWYAGTQPGPAAQSLRAWYVQRDPDNGKEYNRGNIDWVQPAVILGVATGIVLGSSWMWGAELVLWAFILSGGILALYPFYQKFFPELTWSPNGMSYLLGVLQCGFFIGVGRVATAAWLERKTRKNVEKS